MRIARRHPYGTSWLIDDEPVTLLKVIDYLPGAPYHRVVEQTMTALNAAPRPPTIVSRSLATMTWTRRLGSPRSAN